MITARMPSQMDRDGWPAPNEGFVVTTLLIVRDQDRSRDFYTRVLGAEVVNERDPVILRVSNSWVILNVGGGPTPDKPTVTAAPPSDPDTLTSCLNLRVADIAAAYDQWTKAGAEFLTEPVEYPWEIRAYMRDPDGYLIEVGQSRRSADG